jgi:hypothetical protein
VKAKGLFKVGEIAGREERVRAERSLFGVGERGEVEGVEGGRASVEVVVLLAHVTGMIAGGDRDGSWKAPDPLQPKRLGLAVVRATIVQPDLDGLFLRTLSAR